MVPVNRNTRPWNLTVRPAAGDTQPRPHSYTTTHLDSLLQEAYQQLTDPWQQEGQPPRPPFEAATIRHRERPGVAVLSIVAGRVWVSGWGDVDQQVRRLLTTGVSAGYRAGLIPGGDRAEWAGLIPYGDRVTWKLEVARGAQAGPPMWYADGRATMRDAGGYVRDNADLVATVSRADPAAGQVRVRYADGHYHLHGHGSVAEDLHLEPVGNDDALRIRRAAGPPRTDPPEHAAVQPTRAPTACRSGQHTWLDPANATKCCNPLWARHLVVYGPDDRPQPDDRPVSDLPGTAWRWVPLEAHHVSRRGDPQLHHHVVDPADEIPLD